MRWYHGMSYPIQSGAACIGCSNANFWDEGASFSDRLPQYAPLVDVDTIGAAAAIGTTAAVAVHGALSVVQRHKRDQEEAAEEKGQVEHK